MTGFEDWHKEHAKYMEMVDIVPWCKDAFAAGAASRDAEVAELKAAYVKVTERIHMVGGFLDQIKECDQLRNDVKVLREALIKERDLRVFGQSVECGKTHWESIRDMRRDVYSGTENALAATEEKQ